MARDPTLGTGSIHGEIRAELDRLRMQLSRLENSTTSTLQQISPSQIADPIEGEHVIDPIDNKHKWYSNGAWRDC